MAFEINGGMRVEVARETQFNMLGHIA